MTGPCANGHQSETSDYCSVCGTPLTATATAPAPAPEVKSRSEQCPNCGSPLGTSTTACAECGHVLSASVAAVSYTHLTLPTIYSV